MKKLALILFFLLVAIPLVKAGAENVLRVRLDDNSPLTISINSRFYKKHGTSITVSDLPSGRHYLRIYEYKEYKDNTGGHARLLFQGYVRVKRNTATYCVLDTKTGELLVKQKSMQEEPTNNSSETVAGSTLTTSKFAELKEKVAKETTDTDKMKMVKSSLKNEQLNTDDVKEIMSWFAFEDSKVTLAKWAYDSAPTINMQELENELTLESSKEDLRNYSRK